MGDLAAERGAMVVRREVGKTAVEFTLESFIPSPTCNSCGAVLEPVGVHSDAWRCQASGCDLHGREYSVEIVPSITRDLDRGEDYS